MRQMKDSGVEWIGDIPQEWILKKIKNATEYISSGTTPTSNNIDYYDGNIYWIQSGDIYGKSVVEDTAVKVTELALTIPSLTLYIAPYIVMAMYGGSIGNIAISLIDACTNQACCCVKNDQKNDLHFLYYWLDMCKDVFLFQAEGGGQPNISQTKIKNQYYVQPPLSEQEKIAFYLDRKCSEIDALVTDIQNEIETLGEYKRSVITEAVTKGLNPDVEMKDSGVEWVGDIPKHWTVTKLKYLLKYPLQYGANETGVEFNEILPRYIRITDISCDNKLKEDGKLSLPLESAKQYMLNDNDILFARSGATVGKTFIYKSIYGIAAFAGYLIRASIKNTASPMYVYYYTLGSHYELWKEKVFTQATIQNIGADKYSNLPISIPKLSEQNMIVDFLDHKCSEIDSIIKEKQQQLETLTEYKKSLIYEYVTGKKEVLTV